MAIGNASDVKAEELIAWPAERDDVTGGAAGPRQQARRRLHPKRSRGELRDLLVDAGVTAESLPYDLVQLVGLDRHAS